MSAASDYLENALLNHTLTGTAYTQPTTRYIGLFTADTGLEANTPSAEVSGNGYARKAATFGAASSGSCSTNATVTFDAASGGNWGTITHIAVTDAVSGGNVLFYGAVTSSKVIEDGDTFQISSGNLTITLA